MRYLAHTSTRRKKILETIGVSKIDDLFKDVAASVLNPSLEGLPDHQSEWAVEQHFRKLANQNRNASDGPFFIGGGIYRHHIPAAVDYLIQRGEFLTSYTPYQPEISQGTLQYLFEFQTQVSELTGMDVANASLYDGATSMVEAIMMAQRVTNRKKSIISGGVHPHYTETAQTYAKFGGFSLECLKQNTRDLTLTPDTACVVIQYPNFFGEVNDFRELSKACHDNGSLLVVVVTEIMSLGLLEAPGKLGADIVVGEGQSLGNGMNFGGPTLGLFACQEKHIRQMPGRIVGETVDKDGKRGWVLTLSTREQHIRREKATSNICTNSGLCVLGFTIHLSLLGAVGLERVAKVNHAQAIKLRSELLKIPGIKIITKNFFNEFTIELPVAAEPLVEALAKNGILAGIPLSRLYPGQFSNQLLLSATEVTSDEDIAALSLALRSYLS
ncbi:MAG: aminomethyl-transferring glycine dehydrogenase subunit GcvPA [Alphaproteobacteria bacterium]|nr:aminomethyl-transferring glycine dehydrogenase subunit GcvPA [Alphaproteobacteria bacterium]